MPQLTTQNHTNRALTPIPTRWVGPIKIAGAEFDLLKKVPLATLERPLWSSVSRGARLTRICGGLTTVIVKECMTRSILVEADSASYLITRTRDLSLPSQRAALIQVAKSTSSFLALEEWQTQIIGNLLYIRFSFNVGDAAGHNMTTKAADALLNWLLTRYSLLRYISISGNFCVDKKVSAVNSILGRGKYVVAEMLIPHSTCSSVLRASPEKIVELHIKKNLLGSIAAGSICSANAHFANMLLAFYLTTGQDVANIVEGSQGIVHAELRDRDLYFSVTLPNLIVGTIGSGKNLAFVQQNLAALDCLVNSKDMIQIGTMARKLAILAAASVWCGEISLLAAQLNRGELVRSHMEIERK